MVELLVPLIVISGPVGVGKTTVGHEISNWLSQRGTPHSFIDLDALSQTFPRTRGDRFGNTLALRNLRDVWANCAAVGSRNLIIARVVETQSDIQGIQRSIPDSKPMVCQLWASDATLIERVRTREVGSGRAWHEARALELAKSLRAAAPADFVVDTEGRSVPNIADEIASQVDWVANA